MCNKGDFKCLLENFIDFHGLCFNGRFIGIGKKLRYFWRDLNPQSPASEADALSIRPQKHHVIKRPWDVFRHFLESEKRSSTGAQSSAQLIDHIKLDIEIYNNTTFHQL